MSYTNKNLLKLKKAMAEKDPEKFNLAMEEFSRTLHRNKPKRNKNENRK